MWICLDTRHLPFPWSTRLFNSSERSNLMIPSFSLPDRVQWTNWSRRQTWPWLWGPIPGGTSSWRPSLSVQVRGSQDGHRPHWEKQATPEKREHGPISSYQFLGRFLCPGSSAQCSPVPLGHFGKNHGVAKRAWLFLVSDPGSTVWPGTSSPPWTTIPSFKKKDHFNLSQQSK